MLLKAFSVFDVQSGVYGVPFFQLSKGTGLRVFMKMIRDPESPVSESPKDYTLFEVGDFDSCKGVLIPYAAPMSIGNALEFITPSENGKVVVLPGQQELPGGGL